LIVADVRCPQTFDLLCVRTGLQHTPAIDVVGTIREPDRGELHAEAFQLGNECVNVEFGCESASNIDPTLIRVKAV
jgi:hypothetical protein